MDVFRDMDIDPDLYTIRRREPDEALPWDMIDTGVTKEFLLREMQKALREGTTEDCRGGACNSCGWQRYEGVCANAG